MNNANENLREAFPASADDLRRSLDRIAAALEKGNEAAKEGKGGNENGWW